MNPGAQFRDKGGDTKLMALHMLSGRQEDKTLPTTRPKLPIHESSVKHKP